MNKYRINKLDIEGFRIYSRKQSINIYNNLTVVYGRNGRGKTTLQDAIGWLFNNNIARYITYKGEWNRAKKTHIRSLINPDIETQITGYFEEISNKKIHKIIRNETEVFDSSTLIDSFFDSPVGREDLLWANSLSQSRLQELAVANGRDRLENLAPLLDLTEVNNKVKELDDQLKENRAQLIELEKKRNKISEKDQGGLLGNFRMKTIELENTLNSIISLPLKPNNNMSAFSEVEEWKNWLKDVLNKVIEKKGEINSFMSQTSEDDMKFIFKKQDKELIKPVEELERELKITIQQEDSRKKEIQQLKNNLNVIEKEIQTILTHFENLKTEMNNEKHSYNAMEQLEIKVQAHFEISEEIGTKEKEMDLVLEQEKEVKVKLNKLNDERNEIEKYYSEFINNKDNIGIHENTIDEINKWLSENSDNNNKELLDTLEKELDKFDDRFGNIYDEQKKLEESFNVLTKNVSGEQCPLCGVEHHSEQHLMLSIKNEKERSIHNLLELNGDFTRIKNRIKEIKGLTILKLEKEKQLRESSRIIKDIEAKNEQMKTILEPMINFYKMEVEDLSDKLFLKLFKSNELQEVELKNTLTGLEKKHEELKRELDALNDLIKSEKELYDNSVKELNETKNQIESMKNNILKKLSYYGYEEDLDEHNINNYIKDFKNNIEYQIQELESNNFLVDIKNIRNELYNNYTQQQEELSNIFVRCKELEEFLNAIEESIKLLNINANLDQEIKKIETNIEHLNDSRKKQREIQRIETNKEIGKMATRISTIFEVLSDTSPWKTIMSDAVVPGARERTNLIFRPIPHKFENDLENYIESTNSNSTFAFSGGQLSLLGLSIFLSQVADDHSKSDKNKAILDTIILDDPIQMLDTLRDDALVSLICDIAQEKQIIISTSDINFANKLILASRPLWEFEKDSCGVLHFDKLEEEGPVIHEYSPDKWINDQRIYLPKLKGATS